MYYSAVALIALLMNLILNWDLIKPSKNKTEDRVVSKKVKNRYKQFIFSANLFFIAEISWGLLYDYHGRASFLPFVYSNTVFYFIFILLTMLTWGRYVVAFLDKGGRGITALTHGVWTLFVLGILALMLNRFYHFIFYFNSANEYVPAEGRNLVFSFPLLFYLILSIALFVATPKVGGRLRTRYMTVAWTSVALGVFMFLQILESFFPIYVVGLMLGSCMIHSFVEASEKKDKEIQDRITSVMAEDYEAIFYFEINSGEYIEFSRNKKYGALNHTKAGNSIYNDALLNIETRVHPDDKETARQIFTKEAILSNLEDRRSFSFKVRIIVKGVYRYFLFTYMRADDDKHIILYEKDIEDELVAEKKRSESQKQTITFTQIAESLASNYDAIYYINIENSNYISFEINKEYGELEIGEAGIDFYGDCMENIPVLIYEQDLNLITEFLDKDRMISVLDKQRADSVDYRIMMAGNPRYTRMTVRKSSDGTHFILCVENIEDEVEREKQRLRELKSERDLARRDELTGIKNKNAYKELEESAQGNMDQGLDYLPFALVVCDANNLKQINDTLGHAAGDEYIKAAAKLLCNIFVHSPVFRIGGDEFVVFLRGNDYYIREELMTKLRNQVMLNKKSGDGVILASGMSEYNPKEDTLVSEIFERADKQMYENKRALKEKAN